MENTTYVTKNEGYKFMDVITLQVNDSLINKILLEIPYYNEVDENDIRLLYIDITGIIVGAGINLKDISSSHSIDELPSICEQIFVGAVSQLDENLEFPGYVYDIDNNEYTGIADVTIHAMCEILNIIKN